MKLWIASRECAEIAEAGGVKNVTYSLCKEFSLLKHSVTLFIPLYKCTSFKYIQNFEENFFTTEIFLCNSNQKISFSKATFSDGNFNVIFVNHPSFAEKEGIYTYTINEQNQNPEHVKGQGHKDSLFLDVLFQKAVSKYYEYLYKNNQKSKLPDVIHCQDASTGCIPSLIQNAINDQLKTKYFVTIHNAGPAYHHYFDNIDEAAWYTNLPFSLLEKAQNNRKIEPFLLANESGATLTTVSEDYAKELVDPHNYVSTEGLSSIFYERMIHIEGITNGIDADRYNPEDTNVSLLPFAYSPKNGQLQGKFECRKFFLQELQNQNKKDLFSEINIFGSIQEQNEPEKSKDYIYIAYHGRITSQKGISVLIQTIPTIINNFSNVRFVIAGQGQVELERELIDLSEKYCGKVLYLNGYNKACVRLATAVCDFIVLPSYFEPCGLEDFIGQIFGTLPIAHKTGGLNKIKNNKTGFLYSQNTQLSLIAKLSEVVAIKMYNPKLINKMIKTAATTVENEYSWKKVIKNKYLKLFEKK
jgi:starch synthase